MPVHTTRRSVLVGALGFSLLKSSAAKAAADTTPAVEFVSNPLADYLHLLLFRAPKPRLPVFTAPGFDAAPTLDQLVSVPEMIAAAGIDRYDEVEPFVARTFAGLPARSVAAPPLILSYSPEPPLLATVLEVIRAGEPWFEAFEGYWRASVAPAVEAQIGAWREQESAHRPLKALIEMQRLPLRAPRLMVAAMPFHPAGSANYSPAGVYTSLFRTPDLGRVLGHEASHLLWSEAVGTDWKTHPMAAGVKALAAPKGLDIEETMCLLMQTILSQQAGVQPEDYRVSSDLQAGPQRILMTELERGWPDYMAGADRWPTLIDYVLETAAGPLGRD